MYPLTKFSLSLFSSGYARALDGRRRAAAAVDDVAIEKNAAVDCENISRRDFSLVAWRHVCCWGRVAAVEVNNEAGAKADAVWRQVPAAKAAAAKVDVDLMTFLISLCLSIY